MCQPVQINLMEPWDLLLVYPCVRSSTSKVKAFQHILLIYSSQGFDQPHKKPADYVGTSALLVFQTANLSLAASLIEILAFLTVVFIEGLAYQSLNLCYTSQERLIVLQDGILTLQFLVEMHSQSTSSQVQAGTYLEC